MFTNIAVYILVHQWRILTPEQRWCWFIRYADSGCDIFISTSYPVLPQTWTLLWIYKLFSASRLLREEEVSYQRTSFPIVQSELPSFCIQTTLHWSVPPQFTHKPKIAEHIRTCDPRPSKAFAEARAYQADVRPDWKQVNVQMVGYIFVMRTYFILILSQMDVALRHKFDQHDDLRDELLGTGDAELVEVSWSFFFVIWWCLLTIESLQDSDKDPFWGIGKDGKGRNELGKALERLRTKMRQEPRRKPRHRRAPRPFPFLNTILYSLTILLSFWLIFVFLRVSPHVFSSLDIHRIFRSLVRL